MTRRYFAAWFGFLFLLSSCSTGIPDQNVQYYRVRHDSQLEVYHYKSRTADDHWNGVSSETPEMVPLFVKPKASSGTHRTKLTDDWETYMDALNKNDEKTLRYLKADDTALFNSTGFPKLESLTMGGNLITLDEVNGAWGRVHTLEIDTAPSPEKINYSTSPDLVHKFVVVGWRKTSKETYWTNPPRGDMYWPLVSSRAIWIQMERIEKFPELPIVVIANSTVYIQGYPGTTNEPTLSRLFNGQSATVIEYHPSGSNVWGKLSTGGWIALLWYPEVHDPQYHTTWTMETLPPPPPSD